MHLNKKFISVEGGDGAGKSTFIPSIKEFLESKGEKVVLTREPGGTPLGEKIREIVLFGEEKPSLMAETLLMLAARAEHHEKVVIPALESGAFVICDRHADSTYAYQCSGKGFSVDSFEKLSDVVQNGIRPGLTFILEVPLEVGLQRLAKTGKVPDNFEKLDSSFKQKVSAGYREVAGKDPQRCKIIDASMSIEQTQKQALQHLNEYLKGLNLDPKKFRP